jgi:hypothetical protein
MIGVFNTAPLLWLALLVVVAAIVTKIKNVLSAKNQRATNQITNFKSAIRNLIGQDSAVAAGEVFFILLSLGTVAAAMMRYIADFSNIAYAAAGLVAIQTFNSIENSRLKKNSKTKLRDNLSSVLFLTVLGLVTAWSLFEGFFVGLQGGGFSMPSINPQLYSAIQNIFHNIFGR